MCVCVDEGDSDSDVFEVFEEGDDFGIHILCDDMWMFGWDLCVCEGDIGPVRQMQDEGLMLDVCEGWRGDWVNFEFDVVFDQW